MLRIQKYKNILEKAQRDYYLSNTTLDQSLSTLIDQIINEVLEQYKIINFTVLDTQGTLYITEEMQNKMIEEIFKTVYTGLSATVYDKLLLVYNESYIEDMIAKKVQFAVLTYSIEVNGTYQDDKK